MKRILTFCLLALFVAQVGEASQKKKRKRTKKTKKIVRTKETAGSSKTDTLIISFISIGSGVDANAVAEFEKDLNNSKQGSCPLTYEMKRWGREGERDYIITSANAQCLKTFQINSETKFNENRRVRTKSSTLK